MFQKIPWIKGNPLARLLLGGAEPLARRLGVESVSVASAAVMEEELASLVLDTVVVLQVRLGSCFILSASSAFCGFQLADGLVGSRLGHGTRAFDVEGVFRRVDSHVTIFDQGVGRFHAGEDNFAKLVWAIHRLQEHVTVGLLLTCMGHLSGGDWNGVRGV